MQWLCVCVHRNVCGKQCYFYFRLLHFANDLGWLVCFRFGLLWFCSTMVTARIRYNWPEPNGEPIEWLYWVRIRLNKTSGSYAHLARSNKQCVHCRNACQPMINAFYSGEYDGCSRLFTVHNHLADDQRKGSMNWAHGFYPNISHFAKQIACAIRHISRCATQSTLEVSRPQSISNIANTNATVVGCIEEWKKVITLTECHVESCWCNFLCLPFGNASITYIQYKYICTNTLNGECAQQVSLDRRPRN